MNSRHKQLFNNVIKGFWLSNKEFKSKQSKKKTKT